MDPDLAVLLQVQDLERELIALKSQAQAISIPLEKCRARRQATRRDLILAQEKLERTTKNRREQEKELEELEAKLRATEERLSAVRTPREAEALNAEIERTTQAAAAAEEAALTLMEQEEHQGRVIEETRVRIGRDLEVIEEEFQRLAGLLEENQSLAAGLREERIAKVNQLSPEVRSHYDWLLKQYGPGQTVSPTDGGACNGCGSMLLPAQALKVHDRSVLHRCSHCARYLVG